ncbi:gliding motility-associated lipoprotein GldK [Altererythrobacter sp. B11]|uniref:formylglycine-generating enzyme family protein n=1 Tax=Altererythrobacter sp. B11 TaxID=2060312 RepID=UPI000DC7319A|nr:formylglycine-generating enzyme family protein [Altererythrobacter sp. B11]BBC71981.1 gliding motility-associated lipoprotein GldK [Altererythrobacter sp. B11]
MQLIPGGIFTMGSDNHYPEEAPARKVKVSSFWLDTHPVTNAEFAAFVADTGYVTTAETAPKLEDYPDADPSLLRPASSLFVPPQQPVPLHNPFAWWRLEAGASWKHPYGPDSDIEGLADHPVVHVSHEDASQYAEWAGKRLPTEAEWERAARGGLEGTAYAWGEELTPGGKMLANFWQGSFPWQNSLEDGYLRTSPIGTYPANPFGLYDMIGNVWEWTSDWYAEGAAVATGPGCCVPENPRGGERDRSYENGTTGFPRKVLKGGSHLCAENYCRRYRPASRYPQTIDTSTSHIGFRCARDA